MSAVVILKNDRCSGEYEMFDLRSLDEEGAVLAGPLFLEIGETLRLRVDKEGEAIEREARVQSVAEDEGTMRVEFL